MVELVTVLNTRPLAKEMTSRSTFMYGLHGVLTAVLDDVEKKPFPSKLWITATRRDLAWLLVHMGRA